jgi:hypothetical protein
VEWRSIHAFGLFSVTMASSGRHYAVLVSTSRPFNLAASAALARPGADDWANFGVR